MRSVDPTESFAPLGKAIPAPAPPAPTPAVDGKFIRHPDGTVATNIPKPPAPPYTLQGMWGRDQKANPPLKWVGEAADAWRGIHAQQAADMAVIRDMGRINMRDVYRKALSMLEQAERQPNAVEVTTPTPLPHGQNKGDLFYLHGFGDLCFVSLGRTEKDGLMAISYPDRYQNPSLPRLWADHFDKLFAKEPRDMGRKADRD